MKKAILTILLILSISALTSCMSGGNKFNLNAVSHLEIGNSEQQVIHTLGGRPTDRITNNDGTYDLSWFYVHGAIWHYKGDVATIRFSKDGKMVEIIRKSSTISAGK